LERDGKCEGHTPGDRDPDEDIVDDAEDANLEYASVEEQDGELDDPETKGTEDMVRVLCLFVDIELFRVGELAVDEFLVAA
jgi:hypothetical protein